MQSESQEEVIGILYLPPAIFAYLPSHNFNAIFVLISLPKVSSI